jgi:hypothetical protein
MKALSLACLLLTAAHVDAADPITLQDTECATPGAQCGTVAPGITLAYMPYYNQPYGRLTLVVNGVTYTSATQYSATPEGGVVYANGQPLTVTTVFATWQTCTRTGRGQSCLTHWELKSGSVQ